ncbi:hypothetical protein LOM8899_00157 [Flavimaricola marinus]|uniref:Uncharacterized protein n=1 Tax=Flavimaricola marinus TaxID=1819565 RepID=A0A238LAN7_9RHOB|nr:hypothetical protein LOM8899_00157 [Flavimaricola marinus]
MFEKTLKYHGKSHAFVSQIALDCEIFRTWMVVLCIHAK